jgi:alanine-synthesizing transaminase
MVWTPEQEEFPRIKRLPPYVFAEVDALKMKQRRAGEDIVDLGMGNPDLPAPKHIIKKLQEVAEDPHAHRYSASKGIPKLRAAISDWYYRRYNVSIDPESEAVVTIGAKEGISHLALATLSPGDVVMVPTPSYPIHTYASIIAGADVHHIPVGPGEDFMANLERSVRTTWPRPKFLLTCFPHNPTTILGSMELFEDIVAFAKENKMWLIHDFAYADLVYDGIKVPSMMQVKGAKDVAVEFFSMTKSYSMAGWRMAFCVGNQKLVHALTRMKSYLDYGIFTPIQVAGIVALNGPQECVGEIVAVYQSRRDTLCEGLARIGWDIPKPKATMFVWAKIPERYAHMGSLEFAKMCLLKAGVAVAPGVGFGEAGEGYVRFALVENEQRIQQAIRGLRKVLNLEEAAEE